MKDQQDLFRPILPLFEQPAQPSSLHDQPMLSFSAGYAMQYNGFVTGGGIIHISDSALKVLIAMKYHMNAQSGDAYPSIKTIMAETGKARATVVKALKELDKKGFLHRQPARRSSVTYRVVERLPINVHLGASGQAEGQILAFVDVLHTSLLMRKKLVMVSDAVAVANGRLLPNSSLKMHALALRDALSPLVTQKSAGDGEPVIFRMRISPLTEEEHELPPGRVTPNEEDIMAAALAANAMATKAEIAEFG